MFKRQLLVIYVISFLTAFCSLIYELQYSQLLSVLYGNSVLRYSLTIGLYLFSLGIGSFSFRLFAGVKSGKMLFISQLLLAIIGPLGIVGVIWLDSKFFEIFQLNARNLAIILAHVPIIVTGIIAGIQVPLLSVLGNSIKKREDMFVEVLGIDYFGSLIGAVSYGLFLYPQIGLIKTAILVGTINVLLSWFCLTFIANKKNYIYMLVVATVFFILLSVNASKIENSVMQMYLRVSIDKELVINKAFTPSVEPNILSFFLPHTLT
jgi:spermidine synthase